MHSSRMRIVRWGGGVCPGECLARVWTEFLTHACQNITFPQLRLRTVKMYPGSIHLVLAYEIAVSYIYFCSVLN